MPHGDYSRMMAEQIERERRSRKGFKLTREMEAATGNWRLTIEFERGEADVVFRYAWNNNNEDFSGHSNRMTKEEFLAFADFVRGA